MEEIKLTQGKVALVDDEDYEYLNRDRWIARKGMNDRTYYAYRYIIDSGYKRKRLFMHNAIVIKDNKSEIDHKDGNGLNNQKHNLRVCTHQQNGMNQRLNINNTSGYKGVIKRGDKYRAFITISYKRIWIGTYGTLIDAALAYNKKALELFGEFANLNIIS